MCDSVNHNRFPKEDHQPNWERRDIKVTKGDRVEHGFHLVACVNTSLK